MKETPTRRLFRVMFKAMAYRPPPVPVPQQGLVLVNVTVVNPGQGRQSGLTLVVEGDRIAHISPAALLSENNCYAGTYVLPGLIDMHVHIPSPIRELVNLLFLVHGVTTVRETGDADGTTWRARRRILNGRVPGPRIFASGPVLDGDPPLLPTSWVVRTAAEAREAVEMLAAAGEADFVKIHHKLSAEALAAIRETAAENGLRVVGHVPMSVPFEKAHVWDVQHLDGLIPYPRSSEEMLDVQVKRRDLDAAQVDFYVQTSVEQGLVHTPTIVTNDRLSRMADSQPQDDPADRFLPRYYYDVVWNRQNGPQIYRSFSTEMLEMMKQRICRSKEVVCCLQQAGVRLHLGTDTVAVPFVVPGASLQEELGHMVGAGLTIEEAWVAGTRAPGESLSVPLLGTIQKGAPADLLIFDADPTCDLAALSTLRAVIAQGRLYPKPFLNAALAHHRERFERSLYDRLTTSLMRLAMKGMSSK